MNASKKHLFILKKLVERLVQGSESLLATQNEMEDLLVNQDVVFVERLREARRQHLAGETNTLENLHSALHLTSSDKSPSGARQHIGQLRPPREKRIVPDRHE